MKTDKQVGKDFFINHYQQLCDNHGPYDAATLFHWLETKVPPVLRVVPEHEEKLLALWIENGLTSRPLPWYEHAWEWPIEISVGEKVPGFDQHWFYPLNPSSLVPVLALTPEPGDLVLDACAAPGGKALFMADLLGERGHLVANDLSRARRARLSQSLQDYSHLRSETWGVAAESIRFKYPDHFDKILLDAPCSSEKHIYRTPQELAKWSLNRIKKLSNRQLHLLRSLWHALKPSGRIVYSTCAISLEENEQVITQFLSDQPSAKLLPLDADLPGGPGITAPNIPAEISSHVRRIWPDAQFDPMFVAVLEKAKV